MGFYWGFLSDSKACFSFILERWTLHKQSPICRKTMITHFPWNWSPKRIVSCSRLCLQFDHPRPVTSPGIEPETGAWRAPDLTVCPWGLNISGSYCWLFLSNSVKIYATVNMIAFNVTPVINGRKHSIQDHGTTLSSFKLTNSIVRTIPISIGWNVKNIFFKIYPLFKYCWLTCVIGNGADGGRTRVQKPVPCSSTIIVCLLTFPLPCEDRHPQSFSSSWYARWCGTFSPSFLTYSMPDS